MPWPGPVPMPVSTTQSFFLRGIEVSTDARSRSSGWLFMSETVGSAVRALKDVSRKPFESVLIARLAGVSPSAAAISLLASLVAETPPSSASPPVVDDPVWLEAVEPAALVAPADATVLPLDGTLLPLAGSVDEPLAVEGVVPVEPTELAPVVAPIALPELIPELAPVPLIEALHPPNAIGTTTPNTKTHAVLMRKVTFTLLVRRTHDLEQ
jgi:hypothetical protein